MTSRGLNTDPQSTPTLTSNASLKELFTSVLLLAPTCTACTTLTNYSRTPATQRAHHSTFRGTLSKSFSKLTNAIHSFLCLARYFSRSYLIIKIAFAVPPPGQKPNCISSILTISRMMFSTTLSITFRTRSVYFSLRQLFRSKASPFLLNKLAMMLLLQSAVTFLSYMIAFIKSAVILLQISGAAFNISETTTPEI